MLTLIGNLLHSATAALAQRRQYRRAYAELALLDDRSLADIGISRSEIPYVLSQAAKPAAPSTPALDGRLRHA